MAFLALAATGSCGRLYLCARLAGGTGRLQSLISIVIDPADCPDTAKEFLGYEYERTKDGQFVSGYPDRDNHHIDAVRYATEPIWQIPGQGARGKYTSLWVMK